MEEDDIDSGLLSRLRALLSAAGPQSSVQLQDALRRSQPSVSRLINAAAPEVLVLGQGRSTRYGLGRRIGAAAASQPLFWIDEDGARRPLGRLALLAGGVVHVQADGWSGSSRGSLPWFLAPLKTEGFIGRSLARQLAPQGLPPNPETWTVEQVLLGALHTPDAPGAVVLGDADPAAAAAAPALPTLEGLDAAQTLATLQALADGAAKALPVGSSAGGEQPKFLLRDHDGHPLLAKFGPPRGTPFGERWHELLHAEHLAQSLLAEHGVPVAATRVVETPRRTLLLSRRFDRTGPRGRRHVVPLHAVHRAFVDGDWRHWARTCEALEQRRRLPAGSAAQVRALGEFGRLIGNNDMHFGNLSLFVERADIARGRFTLAPLYDMLPMRWRPDPMSGEIGPVPFALEPSELDTPARALAQEFWSRVADSASFGREFRGLARKMHGHIRP